MKMDASKTLLNGRRALDLTDDKGFLCGKILADLGVDVIKVEPPGGEPSRSVGPFWHDEPDPEKSLYWFAYNSNKRGITLNLETNDGREIFKELVKKSDFVIESFAPGYLDSLELGYPVLAELNKSIVLTSITPFGQTGPYRDYKGDDLILMGMSGQLYLTGDSDRAPVNIGIPQACLHAGADAAVGSMLAFYHSRKTGTGQRVDVSMQQSAAWFMAQTIPYYELSGVVLPRMGTFRTGSSSGTMLRQVWPCKDGFVFFFMLGGIQGAKTGRALTKWMEEMGMSNEFISTFVWEELDIALAPQELMDRLSAPIEAFFRRCTKKEVLDAAMSRNISICPLFSMEDQIKDPHLAARAYWIQMEHPELGTAISYPRQFVRSSECETGTRFKSPRIGEHNLDVYGEIGLSGNRLVALKEAGVL
ncbi:MAG TPA: CoA transferase [Syntrophorhabdaceae bacterium]|nr:CoA transferase [Syntrophorhabdaceae bacterium]